ncbi:MAG: CusA/CzcA family heavy metal efflux RND transporter [bacterium]|nr:CusA/CzcA family heavy metal efflux RND transporter [bacterium]
MLNKIIHFSIRNKLMIGLFLAVLVGYGSYQLTKLPIDAVPDITNNQVQVITLAPSFGANDIERLITFPIEQANNNIPGLIEIRSFSRFGLSLVTIVFEDNTDIYWARQQVAERLQRVQAIIPKGIGIPVLGPVSTGLGEIYQYVIRPKKGYEQKYSITELRTIQDWIVRRQLLGVRGVAEVSSFGGKLKQYEVAVDPNKLQSYNITISDVFKALESNNENTGGAYIEKGPTVLNIRTEGLIGKEEDIRNTAIRSTGNGTPLFVKDVAEVRIGSATRFGAMCLDDQGEVAGAVVMMLKGANSSDVIKLVKKKILEIQKTLPVGVVLEPFLDRSKMVNNAIGTVETNLMEGALIVIFVLVLFLGNFRAGLLVASVIPLSMLFAVIMMNTFGVSGNLMSLGALDFGLIVDGAVIIVEAVMHRLSASKGVAGLTRLDQKQMDVEVEHSAGRMMNSAVFGQLIILVVYLPIFTLQGIEGKMFKPMAQTVAFALVGAFLLSLTYIPMMSTLFLSRTIKIKKNISDKFMERIENVFQRALLKVLHVPKYAIGIVVSLFVVAMMVLLSLGGEFIPTLEEGDFAVETRLLTGTNLNTTIAGTQKAAHILKTQFPEVQKVVTKIGSGEVPTDPMPMEAADMVIMLKDKKEWTSARSFNELAEKMAAALEDVPGLTYSFQFPVQMRFNELMTGAKQDVVCKIFGEDLDTLSKYAAKLGSIISTVDGAKDLYVETVTGMPQIVISYKRAIMAQYNISVSEVNKIIRAAFAGESSGMVFEGERRFDLVVRLDSNKRKHLQDVLNVLIPTPNGNQVPLSHFADVQERNGPNQIQREDAKRRIIIGFNVRGRDVQSIVHELQDKVTAQVKFPTGYYPTYGGAFENLNAAKKRLSIAVPVSLALIFLLLYFAFNSIRHGLLIYSAIPLSAIGGVFALALRGLPFSISAGVGFIALFGVAVLNGIVLIAEFNRLKLEGIADLREIVMKGTRIRLRPVLMTAAVASLGFLPMALSQGAGAEVQRPLATVVIGGLIIATGLTLFILPVLYVLFEKRFLKKKQKLPLASVLFLGVLTFASPVNAQTRLSLQGATDTALKNNLTVKNERLLAEYRKKLLKSGFDLPQTNVAGEFGQINSSYSDNRFSVTQNFSFPSVYSNQKTILYSLKDESLLNVALKEAELRKNVSRTFFDLQYLKEKQNLLLHHDSLYANFLTGAEQRLKAGESNALEKATAETQRGQLLVQLEQLNSEMDMMQLQFQLLLNTGAAVVPDEEEKKLLMQGFSDTAQLLQHPNMLFLMQQSKTSALQVKLERSKLLPGFFVAYNNMSMKGVGADEVSYTGSSRFQSAQIGVGVPLFFGAQKSRIDAARQTLLIADNNYQLGLQVLETDYARAFSHYRTQQKILLYYEGTALKNADVITVGATKQFHNGEINYLQWVMLTNHAMNLRYEYIQVLRTYNESIIQLNYLSGK